MTALFILPIDQATLPVGAQGTLVSFVPAKNALLVAADSRFTTLGARCDFSVKLMVPTAPPLTIVAGTGTSEWISARYPLWPNDPCGDLKKNGIIFFDAKALTLKYLEEMKQPIWLLDLKALADHINVAIIEAAQQNPGFVQQFAGKTMFQIVVGAFDPATATSYVRALQFNLTDDLKIEVKLGADLKFKDADRPDYPHFGDTETFAQHVMSGAGNRYLPKSFEQIQSAATISDVGAEVASDLAINLIEAAKLASVEIPELMSIGGDVIAYKIDATGVARIK